MNKLLTIIVLGMLTGSCFNDGKNTTRNSKQRNDLVEKELVGDVKSVHYSNYKALDRFGKIEKGEGTSGDYMSYRGYVIIPFYNYLEFNRDGNIVVSATYKSNGTVHSKRIDTYDNNGKKIEEAGYSTDGVLTYKNKFKYDSKGNNIETSNYEADGSLNSKEFFIYDNRGNVIEAKKNEDGILKIKERNTYDNKNNKIETHKYWSDGSFQGKYGYKYDRKGNEIEEVVYLSDGEVGEKIVSKYDNNGNLIEYTNYYEDEIYYKYIYEHDERGNMTKLIDFDLVNSPEPNYIYEYRYVYDSKGNWIEKLLYKNGLPDKIFVREIEYFN